MCPLPQVAIGTAPLQNKGKRGAGRPRMVVVPRRKGDEYGCVSALGGQSEGQQRPWVLRGEYLGLVHGIRWVTVTLKRSRDRSSPNLDELSRISQSGCNQFACAPPFDWPSEVADFPHTQEYRGLQLTSIRCLLCLTHTPCNSCKLKTGTCGGSDIRIESDTVEQSSEQ